MTAEMKKAVLLDLRWVTASTGNIHTSYAANIIKN